MFELFLFFCAGSVISTVSYQVGKTINEAKFKALCTQHVDAVHDCASLRVELEEANRKKLELENAIRDMIKAGIAGMAFPKLVCSSTYRPCDLNHS